uniref:F-box domain-containing protein n=1 Tax=Strongyloides venezuelensis TaxID=75913 RepID=A0A0K0F7T1_STRVS
MRTTSKEVDLTFLHSVYISLDGHTEVMRIFIKYFNNTNIVDSICVTASNCEEDLGNTLSFLQKIQNVRSPQLWLELPRQNVLRDFIIPVRNALLSIVIYERGDTGFINSGMINYFVENNPDLKKYELSLCNLETYRMIVETVVKVEQLRGNNCCFHGNISLSLDIPSFVDPSELLSYFHSEEFSYSNGKIGHEDCFYNSYLRRLVCSRFNHINISRTRMEIRFSDQCKGLYFRFETIMFQDNFFINN